jgi:hypothetical protein
MTLEELEELKDFNELDILYKIIDKLGNAKKFTERTVKGNKTAGIEVRKIMQELRLLSEIMRDKIQLRRYDLEEGADSKLFKEIEKEKNRLIKEKMRLEKLEINRRKRMEEKRQNR